MIFIVEDDELMAECVARATRRALKGAEVKIFSNGVEAMQAMEEGLPDLIFLDILLDGPDGFTLLNELVSYADTARIPVVVVSSLDLSGQDLGIYGVVRVLDKAKMTPEEIGECVILAQVGSARDNGGSDDGEG